MSLTNENRLFYPLYIFILSWMTHYLSICFSLSRFIWLHVLFCWSYIKMATFLFLSEIYGSAHVFFYHKRILDDEIFSRCISIFEDYFTFVFCSFLASKLTWRKFFLFFKILLKAKKRIYKKNVVVSRFLFSIASAQGF